MEQVYETFFFLKYSGGWSFSEAYNLPVGLRMWFAQRLMTQIEREHEAIDKAQAKNSNSPMQVLTPQNQPQMPPHMKKK